MGIGYMQKTTPFYIRELECPLVLVFAGILGPSQIPSNDCTRFLTNQSLCFYKGEFKWKLLSPNHQPFLTCEYGESKI